MKQLKSRQPAEQLRQDYLSMGKFQLDLCCAQGLFSPEEIRDIQKYGYWFKALSTGDVPVLTEKQKHFVKAQKKGYEPKSKYERLWYRYTDSCRLPF